MVYAYNIARKQEIGRLITVKMIAFVILFAKLMEIAALITANLALNLLILQQVSVLLL